MPSFQNKRAAEGFAAALRSWDREGDGAFGHRTADHTGQFHVVVLTPADLHLGNVPDVVLIPPSLMSQDTLSSSDAWRAAVESIAGPQLQAWQDHVAANTPAAAPATDTAPTREDEPAHDTPSAPPQAHDHSQDGEAAQSAPPQHAQHEAAGQHTAGGQEAPAQPAVKPHGPPLPPSMAATASDPAAEARDVPKSPNGEQQRGASGSAHTPAAQSNGTTPQASSQSASQPPPAVHGPPVHGPPAAAAAGDGAEARVGEPTQRQPPPEARAGPKVYASVADLEADQPWDMTDGGNGSSGGYASDGGGDGGAPTEELRLLTEEETDASVVHADVAALKVVFTPILMRNGSDGTEDAGEGRMMFTVDATLDEGDPDVVALAFEDPAVANAMLSMLAHVCGFTDADGVIRRVVPMPPGAAAEAAEEQGASLLCMASGFQAKANVRAGRDINGVLSRIAGARWASLMQQQQAVYH